MPDPAEGQRRDSAEKTRLEQAKAAMSPTDLEEVMAAAEDLKQRQETPDSPEALASLPALKLSDIDPHVKTIPIDAGEFGGVRTIPNRASQAAQRRSVCGSSTPMRLRGPANAGSSASSSALTKPWSSPDTNDSRSAALRRGSVSVNP